MTMKVIIRNFDKRKSAPAGRVVPDASGAAGLPLVADDAAEHLRRGSWHGNRSV
jgi:hypothetical protein